jgi:single-strand DNA-binding protein
MNSVNLIGRITKDIELRVTQSGISCVSMNIAINNGKGKDGKELPADFPKIYVYDKQAENIHKYCKKGSQISVCGSLKTRSWKNEDGTMAYETYVRANRIQFLENKSESVSILEPADNVKPQEEYNGIVGSDEIEITDGDLPF